MINKNVIFMYIENDNHPFFSLSFDKCPAKNGIKEEDIAPPITKLKIISVIDNEKYNESVYNLFDITLGINETLK